MLIEITYNVTDVFMSTTETPVYVEISFEQPGGSAAVWGSITGTLSNQTDLQNALNAKLDESTIDGGTEGQILSKASATDFDFAWINNYAKYLATNVRNQTGSTIGAFQVVYISGATGNKPLISLADADTEATSSKTYGVTATSIANNGTGDVVTAGELSGINTSAFNEGDLLWLSTTAGGVVTSPPAEPAHAVFIGYVVRSHPTLGVIDVAIANGYELNELHGVQITSAANNDGLFYNSTSTLWENKSIATVLGYTPEQPLTFNSPLSRAGNVVSIPQATGSVNGFLSATDWTTFNSKQAALGFTPANAATTLTINGVTYDLSTSRTWNIAAGISGSGAAGQVTYWTGASAITGSSALTFTSSGFIISTAISTGNYKLFQAINTFDAWAEIKTTGTNNAALCSLSSGDGTTSGRYAYFMLQSLETSPQRWDVGLRGNKNLVYYNTTLNSAALTVQSSNNNISIGTISDLGVRLGVVGDTLLRGSGSTNTTTGLTVQNSSSTNLLRVLNNGDVSFGADAMFWDNANGRLGIGTNAPAFKLDVNGGARLSGSNDLLTLSGSSTRTTFKMTGTAGGYTEVVGNGTDFYFTTNGNTNISFITNNVDRAKIYGSTGNLVLQNGGTFTDGGQRLQVYGDTLLRGSGATSATTALTVQNSSSTNLLTVRNDGLCSFFRPLTTSGAVATFYGFQTVYQHEAFIEVGMQSSDPGVAVIGGSNVAGQLGGFIQTKNGTRAISFASNGAIRLADGQITSTNASTLAIGAISTLGANVPNKVGSQVAVLAKNINITGTATLQDQCAMTGFGQNSLTINLIPTTYTHASTLYVDGAPLAGTNVTFTNRWSLYANAGNIYSGENICIGTTSASDWLNIAASTTAKAHIFLAAGVAPTSPANGDIWFDGTDIKMRIGGVTKTFTLV